MEVTDAASYLADGPPLIDTSRIELPLFRSGVN